MNIRIYILVIIGFMISISAFAFPQDTVMVKVIGMNEDARFEPAVIQVEPGDVIRFEVEKGLHTVTAYHPDNRRPLRMPENSPSFDSGPLSEGQSWLLKLDEPGVYDYFCLPHERMGHAGRIISGEIDAVPDYSSGNIPEKVLQRLMNETVNFLKK